MVKLVAGLAASAAMVGATPALAFSTTFSSGGETLSGTLSRVSPSTADIVGALDSDHNLAHRNLYF